MSVWRGDDFESDTRVLLWHFNAIIITGNAINLVVASNMVFNFQANQNAAALGDKWRHRVYLKAGNYTLDMLCLKKSTSGNLGLTIVNASTGETTYSGSFDLYAAADAVNTKLQDTAVTINRDGYYDLIGEMASKNGASSGYTCYLNMISLWRE